MKRLHFALCLLLMSVLFFNCQKEFSSAGFGTTSEENNLSAPIIATLQGNILDETGQPANGVQITVGTKTATTNTSGYFRIADAALDKNAALVTAEKPGYFKGYRTFCATDAVNQVVIKLIKKTLAGSVNAVTGGEVLLSNSAKISLPANGVVRESDGVAYSGNINVYASYIDPTAADLNETIPGSFMANDKNNKRVTLKSFGMMAVVLESTSGEKLQIANGNSAKLTIPVPSSVQSSAPATMSLWYVDEQTGLWKEEGSAIKSGSSYKGDVKHFSFWNCDLSEPAVSISMTIKNSSNFPLIYANVLIKADTGEIGQGYTDSLGRVNGLVPANVNLVLQVLDECGATVYSQNIGPFSQNIDLGNITVRNSSSSVVTIKGILKDCNNATVSSGYALLSYNNMIRYAAVNNKGEFSMTFLVCSAIQSTIDIFGVDLATLQQGPTVNISISSREVNTGDIFACGTMASEYIKFNLDGTQQSLVNSPPGTDSFNVYSYPGPLPLFTTSAGGRQLGTYISFEFTNSQAAGVFPVTRLSLSYSGGNCILIQPFNINLTNYPQNIGEFYEGNFSGQFKDSLNLTSLHNINCTFRMKKSQ